MIFSYYSFVMAVIWVNIFVGTFFLFHRPKCNFSLYPVFFLLFLCILRILMPTELPYTYTVDSTRILPVVQTVLNHTMFHIYCWAIPVYAVILFVWISVAIAIIARYMLRYYHLKRALALLPENEDDRLCRILSEINADRHINLGFCKTLNKKILLSNIKIAVHPAVKTPAIVGLRKPVIILPHTDFTDAELYYIFFHEYMHYQYGHIFIKLLTGMLQAFLWWSPLLKRLLGEISHALEMHSDQKVCNVLDRKQQEQYLKTILTVIKNLDTHRNLSFFSCNIVETGDAGRMQQRFRMILNGNPQGKRVVNKLVVVGMLFMFLFSYAFVFQPYSEPAIEDYGYTFSIPSDAYLIEVGEGYNCYDSEHEFLGHFENIEGNEDFENLKVYSLAEWEDLAMDDYESGHYDDNRLSES